MCTLTGQFLFCCTWKYFVEYNNHVVVYSNAGLCKQCSLLLIKNNQDIPTLYV
jgi:hypothetical protein